jgi:PDZ domain-containing protein
VVLFVLALTLPVPYVVLSPGPTFNTLGTDDRGQSIIKIIGHNARNTSGNLNMTTVDVSTHPVSVFEAMYGWLKHDEVVVPKSSIYPPGQSQNQINQQNAKDFSQSQDNAIAAAACELGYPKKFGVVVVEGNTPAQGKLQPGDVLVSLNGHPIDTNDKLRALLAATKPGTSVTLVVMRTEKPVSVQLTLAQSPNESGAFIGIQPGTVCDLPFTVDLGLGNEIGGPSAGLMFALGIMDKVGTTDLTGGRFIAGTGTIDPDGTVGPIGGIQLKMIAARRAGATIFLAPAGNCTDVRGAVPHGLHVVKVATLHEAVQDLLAVQSGKSVPGC